MELSNIALICGGPSSEHEISLATGAMIAEVLDSAFEWVDKNSIEEYEFEYSFVEELLKKYLQNIEE